MLARRSILNHMTISSTVTVVQVEDSKISSTTKDMMIVIIKIESLEKFRVDQAMSMKKFTIKWRDQEQSEQRDEEKSD